jgi:hypothetical protein
MLLVMLGLTIESVARQTPFGSNQLDADLIYKFVGHPKPSLLFRQSCYSLADDQLRQTAAFSSLRLRAGTVRQLACNSIKLPIFRYL